MDEKVCPHTFSSKKSVGMNRLELSTSTSRTWRATNCATSRTSKWWQRYTFFLTLQAPSSLFHVGPPDFTYRDARPSHCNNGMV